MKKSKKLFDKNKVLFLKNNNQQVIVLFGLITLICIFFDFNLQNSNLTIPFIITTLVSSAITLIGIPQLKKIKVKQVIREEGPKNHFIKQGTPTMGGIFFIPIGIIISNILYFNTQDYKVVLTLSVLIIFFMFIGLIDDLLSLKKQFNTGLNSNQKIILQLIISLIFIIFCASNGYINNSIQIENRTFNIGNLIYPLGVFVLLAESNSANLTDGLDGLLSGCSVIIFAGLSITILIENSINNTGLSQLCIVMAGACMGFLFLNKYPAKLFMGDSGSLAIGASMGGIALISNNLWSLLIMGGILFAESISVIIQVTIFKISKKLQGKGYKFFLMTPLHHHFELKGNNEIRIVSSFWLVTLLLVISNLIFFIKD
ncbi:phospho-N-acetylmuramoyl-pentapeptide-transferase [Prochlorococcus marinus XMU1408]|uniref:Phospho-N-acetylmuramoyl-pentapeptide-transferase n=1 Tax=Prochlorococcus marinus XMU1408 TaxID=2213228 RepID=A0A318R672_PROMR|nr:phospho-N-acetylmuramoyl-pentapeptide-transferase [Prochlorococcus marinus]MBW3042972.1 phospho-N-acetylmuramoyl-pentapeptide-transferase [Prochlorococcus marinus str. XMU1408]PYE00338.1 phospho-N-acetylmuramoyl-pentapeptide-transferase [Prochlorococcus marinus XMU1408]